jgi:hypothetical protein
MRAFLLLLAVLFQDSPVVITSPKSGETLRGLIQIQGGMDSPDFESAELAFAFAPLASDPAAGWFVIQTFSQPVAVATLAEWDTTAVTDGDYTLRLKVKLKDGSFREVLVTDLKIRNDQPVPTPTPPPTLPNFDFSSIDPSFTEAGVTATPSAIYPTTTPLPANPASLNTKSISTIFWKSAIAVLLLFGFFSLLLRLRSKN